MAEAIYKIGDILELDGNASFPRQFGMFPKDTKIRCMVLKHIEPGCEFVIYTLLVYKIDGSFDTVGINQKDLVTAAKRVGHIDISSFLSNEESTEPDYALFFAAATLAQAADLRNELDKIKKENEELKVERDEANHEISRLRTVVGGLNDVIDDLNASKSEISDLFYSLKNALQTNDILEGANKLMKENERLSNENRELKAMNDELRSSEKIRKLEEENGKLQQKISCTDKLLAEAANRLYQGRALLNISAHN